MLPVILQVLVLYKKRHQKRRASDEIRIRLMAGQRRCRQGPAGVRRKAFFIQEPSVSMQRIIPKFSHPLVYTSKTVSISLIFSALLWDETGTEIGHCGPISADQSLMPTLAMGKGRYAAIRSYMWIKGWFCKKKKNLLRRLRER